MKYFYLEPEVGGGLGKDTVMDRSVHPPTVSKLHYQVDGWLGDVLLESFPCFVIAETAKNKLQEIDATGASFAEVEVTLSEQFLDFHPDRKLPKFSWMKVHGIAALDDLAAAPDGRLVVSERALDVLQKLGISHALVAPYSG